ncbi:transposable element Tcb1 transposase [Trichonephila clavipes]|nr:transposable element Tcb1 transposase [Trichonephila clavipes]
MLNSCVMHRHTGPAPGYYGMGWYWISLSHFSSMHCRYFKQPTLHLRGIGASCPSLPSGLAHSHISTGKWATKRGMHCPKVFHYTPAATPDKLWQRVEAAWSDVPQERIQSLFESILRSVAAVISNNVGYSGY